MFELEKDMIPILKKYLWKKYNTSFFIDEFDGWNGIADLVFSLDIDFEKWLILDYGTLFIVNKHFNRINKIIDVNYLLRNTSLSRKKIDWLLNFLEEFDYISRVDDKKYIIKNRYLPWVKKIISIEAKLKDWKSWIFQAIRYKSYSDESYLAISKEFSHRVDIDFLKENNIWLIEVSIDWVFIKHKPKNNKDKNNLIYTFNSNKFSNYFYNLTT